MEKELAKENLWKLRKEIVLNSLYLSDYQNSFGVDEKDLSYFFEGYLEDLEYLMEENIENYSDEMFFDYLGEYDTEDNLYNYYLDTLVD